MNILLTGSHGQVGREVTAALYAAFGKTINLYAFSHQALDITHQAQLEHIGKQCQPDWIINASAYTAVDKAEQDIDAAFAVNHLGAQNLAQLAKQYQAKLLHLSTDYIFAGDQETLYQEEDPASPINVYGQSKWEGERAIQATWDHHIILRVSWVFSPFGHNFVKTMVTLATERDELKVVSDQIGAPTPACDIAAVIVTLLQRTITPEQWGTYHYCGQPFVSWYQFARKIMATAEHYLGTELAKVSPIDTDGYPTPAKRPLTVCLDTTKITQTFGIEPYPWIEGMQAVVKTLCEEHITTPEAV